MDANKNTESQHVRHAESIDAEKSTERILVTVSEQAHIRKYNSPTID